MTNQASDNNLQLQSKEPELLTPDFFDDDTTAAEHRGDERVYDTNTRLHDDVNLGGDRASTRQRNIDAGADDARAHADFIERLKSKTGGDLNSLRRKPEVAPTTTIEDNEPAQVVEEELPHHDPDQIDRDEHTKYIARLRDKWGKSNTPKKDESPTPVDQRPDQSIAMEPGTGAEIETEVVERPVASENAQPADQPEPVSAQRAEIEQAPMPESLPEPEIIEPVAEPVQITEPVVPPPAQQVAEPDVAVDATDVPDATDVATKVNGWFDAMSRKAPKATDLASFYPGKDSSAN